MSKPDWRGAPQWANWLAQNGSPRFAWTWFETKPRRYTNGWIQKEFDSREVSMAGELNLNWEETLESRT